MRIFLTSLITPPAMPLIEIHSRCSRSMPKACIEPSKPNTGHATSNVVRRQSKWTVMSCPQEPMSFPVSSIDDFGHASQETT